VGVADTRRRPRRSPAGANGGLPRGGGRGAKRRCRGGGGAAVRGQVHDGDAGVRRGVGLRQRHQVGAPAGRRRDRGAVQRPRVRDRVPWLH
jgi:hypothetical protein